MQADLLCDGLRFVCGHSDVDGVDFPVSCADVAAAGEHRRARVRESRHGLDTCHPWCADWCTRWTHPSHPTHLHTHLHTQDD